MTDDRDIRPRDELDIDSSDAVRRLGRRRFLVGVGAAAGAASLSSLLAPGRVQGESLPAGASMFSPLPHAVRLADTRPPKNSPRISPNVVRVKVRDIAGVPDSASAVVLTVTGVDIDNTRYITVYPTGDERPVVSNLNMVRGPGEVTANLVTVKVGDLDSVDVFQFHPSHVIVDLLGYYTPVTSAVSEGRFVRLDSAARALDTRNSFGFAGSGTFTPVDLTGHVPADASSVVINLTVTECTDRSFFSALPVTADESAAPTTSNLNVMYIGETRAGSAIVPISTVGGRRRIKIYAKRAAKLIVDVNGYYTGTDSEPSTDGLFVPLAPVRVLDTRLPGQIGKLWQGWVVEATLPGEAATSSAVVLNVTAVEARDKGYVTVSGARQPIPLTSNLNVTGPGSTVPNHVVTPVTAGSGIQVYSSSGAHVLVDLAGYFTGNPLKPSVARFRNPAPPPWVVRIPRLGLTSKVLDGDPDDVTNAGHTWHWTSTGLMGQVAQVAVFGHRTQYGGPYRHLHTMVVGDMWTVTTADNREYTYRMVGRTMVTGSSSAGPPAADILAATRAFPGTTMSFVACTLTNWRPTSLYNRMVVTGELVTWRQL